VKSVRDVVRSIAIGAQGTISPAGTSESFLEAFRNDIAELEAMEADGEVEITYRHTEATSGRKYVDLIRFRRLR
jgi:hypothetical protein